MINVYYDLENGFDSVNETLKNAKEQGPTITECRCQGFSGKTTQQAKSPTPHPSQGLNIN